MGDPAVRDAAPGDARTIAEIRVASWQATYAGLVPQHVLDGLDVARNEAWLTRRLADPGATATLVVEDGRRVVGYALLGPARDVDTAGVGEIEAIYLAPPALGRGFGRALMGEAVNRVGAMGYPAVVLWVLAGNDVARRFYERAGFKTDGTARMLNFDGTPNRGDPLPAVDRLNALPSAACPLSPPPRHRRRTVSGPSSRRQMS